MKESEDLSWNEIDPAAVTSDPNLRTFTIDTSIYSVGLFY
jgi:hypothetical protein